MTELEKMMRAKMYIDKLANGIDPITNVECPADTVLNNVRLSRCFFYVAQILDKVIENGGEVGSRSAAKKQAFQLTDEQKSSIAISSAPLAISVFTDHINAVIDIAVMKKLPATRITNWLVTKGILQQITDEGGQQKKIPTDTAASIGITHEVRSSAYGRDYTINLYDENAQRFIIEHLDEIAVSSVDVSIGR